MKLRVLVSIARFNPTDFQHPTARRAQCIEPETLLLRKVGFNRNWTRAASYGRQPFGALCPSFSVTSAVGMH